MWNAPMANGRLDVSDDVTAHERPMTCGGAGADGVEQRRPRAFVGCEDEGPSEAGALTCPSRRAEAAARRPPTAKLHAPSGMPIWNGVWPRLRRTAHPLIVIAGCSGKLRNGSGSWNATP